MGIIESEPKEEEIWFGIGRYKGQLKDGKPNGSGVFEYKNKNKY